MNTDSRLLKRSLNNGGGKIGSGRPLHIRTDLLPTGLVDDVSCGGREGEVVEEEVVGGEVDYDGEQPGEAAEITFIEEGEGHKTEEETVTVYEVVADEECHEEEWVEEVQLESGEVSRDTGAGVVEEMVFEEEGVEEGEQVIYVTDDGHPVEGDVTFMQVLEKLPLQRSGIECPNLTPNSGWRPGCRLRGDDRNISHCRGGRGGKMSSSPNKARLNQTGYF